MPGTTPKKSKKAKRKTRLAKAEKQLSELTKLIEDLKHGSPSSSGSSDLEAASGASGSSNDDGADRAQRGYGTVQLESKAKEGGSGGGATAGERTTEGARRGVVGAVVSNVMFVVAIGLLFGLVEVGALAIAYASFMAHVLMTCMAYWLLPGVVPLVFMGFRKAQRRPAATRKRWLWMWVVAVGSVLLVTAIGVSGFVWSVVWDVQVKGRVAYDVAVEDVGLYGNAKAWTFTDAVVLTEYVQSVSVNQDDSRFIAPVVSRKQLNATGPVGPVLVWATADKFSKLTAGYNGGYVLKLGRSQVEEATAVAFAQHPSALVGPPPGFHPLLLAWQNPHTYVDKFTAIFVWINLVMWSLYAVLVAPIGILLVRTFPTACID